MRNILITVLLTFVFQIVYSQKRLLADSTSQKKCCSLQKPVYSASYFANFIFNPGLKFGVESLYAERQKTKIKKRKGKEFEKVITKERLLNGDIGFYIVPKGHVGVFTSYGIMLRRSNSKNKQFIFKFNPLGYLRSFYPETYEVKGGDVNKVFLPGRGYYAPSISVGLGKIRTKKKLSARFINLNFMMLVPYNTNVLPIVSIEYGYRFKL